jgi:hypothetical protein
VRKDVLKQFESFRVEFREKIGRSSEVRFGPRETGNDARRKGVTNDRHDDGNRRGRLLGRMGAGRPMDDEDIDIATNKPRQQRGETFVFSLRPFELNDNVLALDIAEVAQARPEGLHRFCGPDGSRGT